MFQRLRSLQISLAAKCQILFGAAVVLIIGAALAVPWHRMEQLTEQLNQSSARSLAENVIFQHVQFEQGRLPRENTGENFESKPAASQPVDSSEDLTLATATHRRTTADSMSAASQPLDATEGIAASRTPLPHIIPIDPDPHRVELTHFERKALNHFRHKPDAPPTSDYYDANQGYLYAQAIYLNRQCIACHGGASLLNSRTPTTAPAATAILTSAARFPLTVDPSRLVGIVSVDIPSRVKENQLLLNRIFIMTAGLLAGTLAILCFYLITTRLILQPVARAPGNSRKSQSGRPEYSIGHLDRRRIPTALRDVQRHAGEPETDDRPVASINKSLDLKLGQLAESNLALYESNRLKSEFLANVSHELRTPLNSILGFADLLKDALSSGPDSKPGRYVHNILQSGRHLLELINDLLDLAKIEAGRMDIRSEPLSLPDLFEGLVNILKPLCEGKQLTIQSTVSGGMPIMQTDPGKLQQVLYNFLANAIKFSPTGLGSI